LKKKRKMVRRRRRKRRRGRRSRFLRSESTSLRKRTAKVFYYTSFYSISLICRQSIMSFTERIC